MNDVKAKEADSIFIKDSCDVLLNVAQSVYNEEIDRFKNTEFKISIAIAFIGVFIGAFLTYMSTTTSSKVITPSSESLYTLFFQIVIFIMMITSLLLFITAIRAGKLEQFELANLVTKEFATLDKSASVSLAAASTYLDAVLKNTEIIDKKLKKYNLGLNLLFWSIFIFAVHIVIEEVIRYAI